MTPCRGGKGGGSATSPQAAAWGSPAVQAYPLHAEGWGVVGTGGHRCGRGWGGGCWQGDGAVPGGGGGPRWRGTRPWGRHPRRSRPSPGRSRCRTRARWSRPRRTWCRLSAGAQGRGLSLTAARQPRAEGGGAGAGGDLPGLAAGSAPRAAGREASRSSPGSSWRRRRPPSLLSRRRPAPRNAAPAVAIFGRRARRGPGPALPKEGAPGRGPGEPGPAV